VHLLVCYLNKFTFFVDLSQVAEQNTSAVISKQNFDDSSGDEKDEERESLRKLNIRCQNPCENH